MNWIAIQQKYQNSVFHIFCLKARYNITRPYLPYDDYEVEGSGFVIDSKRRLALTNNHVVNSAIAIHGKCSLFGEKEIPMRLLSICHDRDVALLEFASELSDGTPVGELLEMNFGDNFSLAQTEEVLTIGYPLESKTLQFTTGIVSGFQATVVTEGDDNSDDEGSLSINESRPSHIQITAPINPGNSGGPILNYQGLIVGIASAGIMFSQNVGYGIGTRTIFQCLGEMIERSVLSDEDSTEVHIVKLPKFSFNWNRTTPDLIQFLGENSSKRSSERKSEKISREGSPQKNSPKMPLTNSKKMEKSTDIRDLQGERQGIYVSEVYPNTIVSELYPNCILTGIQYYDFFWDLFTQSSAISPSSFYFHLKKNKGKLVTVEIDNYGNIALDLPCRVSQKTPKKHEDEKCRRFSLKEILNTLILDEDLTFRILDKGSMKDLPVSFQLTPKLSSIFYTDIAYPKFIPLKYIIIAGICISEMTLNHVEIYPYLDKYVDGNKRFKKYFIIDQVFPQTNASRLQFLTEGKLIGKIFNKKLISLDEALEQYRQFLSTKGKNKNIKEKSNKNIKEKSKEKSRGNYFSLETKDSQLFVLSRKEASGDDQKVSKNFPTLNPPLSYRDLLRKDSSESSESLTLEEEEEY